MINIRFWIQELYEMWQIKLSSHKTELRISKKITYKGEIFAFIDWEPLKKIDIDKTILEWNMMVIIINQKKMNANFAVL